MLPAVHDPRLVALSVLISILGAFAARALAERIADARGRRMLAWLVGGAVADGIGTWSMHYTGKMALRLPVPLQLDVPTVVLSLLVGIVGSGLALAFASGLNRPRARTIGGAAALGCIGVSGLHYTAMHAIRLRGWHHQHRSIGLVALSVLLAVLLSAAAIGMSLGERGVRSSLHRHVAAMLRGLANPTMHYTAMAAVVFVPGVADHDTRRVVDISTLGILGISVVPVMVLVVALLTTLGDRLEKQRALLDELFEQAPQAVALLSSRDVVVRVNREFTRMFGHAAQDALGRNLADLIVPEEARAEYAGLLASGERAERVELESVRLRKDGALLQLSVIRVPVSVPGGEIQTYSILRDISERKQAEQALREYPRRLLETQEAERQRIARELHDEIGQLLTSAGLLLATSEKLAAPLAQTRVAEAQKLIEELSTKVRNLALDLRPALLDDLGLVSALLWLFQRHAVQTGLRIDFKHSGLDGRRFGAEVETAAYRIVQEALTNVVRHSGARQAAVELRVEGGALRVVVKDDGGGFDPAARSGRSSGLAGMRERALLVGGAVSVESRPGAGTRVLAVLPLAGTTKESGAR